MIRKLKKSDYDCGYLDLLSQLTSIEPRLSKVKFDETLDRIEKNPGHQIYVIENKNGHIVSSGTLLIEPKFIHGGSSVGHIEDIVVDNSSRGEGLGIKIVQHLIEKAKEAGCYKISLYCSDKLVKFYQKIYFSVKDIQMAVYVNSKS